MMFPIIIIIDLHYLVVKTETLIIAPSGESPSDQTPHWFSCMSMSCLSEHCGLVTMLNFLPAEEHLQKVSHI